MRHLIGSFVAAAFPIGMMAQQPIDSVYTAKIRELTPTDRTWKFSTEFVETLPASSTVPTPLKVLGYVPGTIGRLSHVADINKYFRALAATSPRTKIFSAGMRDEGREMIVFGIRPMWRWQSQGSFALALNAIANWNHLTF